MSANVAHDLQGTNAQAAAARSTRARIILGIGPATALTGIVWALAQPWRLTLLHPHHQGLWWLLSEPPIYVVLVGVLFRVVIAPGVVEDLEAEEHR
jgi:hypothetical protein